MRRSLSEAIVHQFLPEAIEQQNVAAPDWTGAAFEARGLGAREEKGVLACLPVTAPRRVGPGSSWQKWRLTAALGSAPKGLKEVPPGTGPLSLHTFLYTKYQSIALLPWINAEKLFWSNGSLNLLFSPGLCKDPIKLALPTHTTDWDSREH